MRWRKARSVFALTRQIGVRIARTLAVSTSETGPRRMRGKTCRPRVRSRFYARSVELLDPTSVYGSDSTNTAKKPGIHWGFCQVSAGTPTIPPTRDRRPRPQAVVT